MILPPKTFWLNLVLRQFGDGGGGSSRRCDDGEAMRSGGGSGLDGLVGEIRQGVVRDEISGRQVGEVESCAHSSQR